MSRHMAIDTLKNRQRKTDEPHRLNQWHEIAKAQSENATEGTYLEQKADLVFRVVTFVTIVALFGMMFYVIAGSH